MRSPEYYADNDVETRLGVRALALDAQRRLVALDSGEELGFGKLLLSTGASPRPLPVPGANLPGVHYLRSLADAEKLRKEIVPGRRAVIIGGGFTGAEVADALADKGLRVTVIDVVQTIWAPAFGEPVGAFFQNKLEDVGVRVLTPVHVQAIDGHGRAQRVVTREGHVLDCDFVIASVGVVPRTDLAESAGLAVDNGIMVDDKLESSVEGIFAAGDNARFHSTLCGASMRMEHWPVAVRQGTVAASNMLGMGRTFDDVPHLFSDLCHHRLDYVGCPAKWDEVTLRWYSEERFIAFYSAQGRVMAAALVNDGPEIRVCRELVRPKGRRHDLNALSDPEVALADYVAAMPASD
jgi:3-phenylpropionate/trans-cinnamate dioxygenase ferredoxin reductase subunit